MKTGLVLEGGAMRGMYTAGVLDTFMNNNINADGVIGVSAGALFGVNYLSGQVGRAIRYNKKYNSDKNYMGIRPLLREGSIVSIEYAYNEVPRKLDVFDDEAFKKSGIPFYAVVTDIENATAEYIQIKSVFEQMDTLRASGSMPFVSKPVTINGKKYLDGAVADSIPYKKLCELGYDKLIVVLTRDINYRKKSVSSTLANIYYRKYPEFKRLLLNRHNMYNNSIDELLKLEKDGKVFVVRPSKKIEIGRMEKDPDKLEAVYNLGVKDASLLINPLREYIGS